mgnify:CR=1 FL=1
MVDKICDSLAEALAGIHDGATVMIGGFDNPGLPAELIDALIAQGATGLTILGMMGEAGKLSAEESMRAAAAPSAQRVQRVDNCG